MANLLVRNLPEETLLALKARASRHHRSVQAEVRELIIRDAQEKTGLALLAWAQTVRLPAPIDLASAFSALREDRDDR